MTTKTGQIAANALLQGQNLKLGNTETKVSHDGHTRLYLFGHEIAIRSPAGPVEIKDAGWRTRTTQDRLNAVISVVKGPAFKIQQKDHEWRIIWRSGVVEPWAGSLVL